MPIRINISEVIKVFECGAGRGRFQNLPPNVGTGNKFYVLLGQPPYFVLLFSFMWTKDKE
jgi:hypothetical protein